MDPSSPSRGPVRKLPPLILHPFSEPNGPERLVTSARAGLILHGIPPEEQMADEDLRRQFLDGRYHEIRMLYYLGKDVTRWAEQCMEVVSADETLRAKGMKPESFVQLLVGDTPHAVRDKLQGWGVADYKAIFRRAFGLHAVFAGVPGRESLTEAFLADHDHYADSLYECRARTAGSSRVDPEGFPFEVYASGEYTRLLESEWNNG